MEKYQYQTSQQSGSIRLTDSAVEADIKQGFSQWNYVIPYNELCPRPMRYRTTDSSIWWLLAIGIGGAACPISELLWSDKHHLQWWMIPLMFIGGMGLVAFAYMHRRNHWVTFASPRSFNLTFAREGRDAAKFEHFINVLIQKIESSNLQR